MMYTLLKPGGERSGEENSSRTLVGTAWGFFASINEAMVFALNPPAIAERGIAGGFTVKLEDVGGNGADALFNARNQLLAAAGQSPILAGVRPPPPPHAPQLRVLIHRIQARALALSLGDVNGTPAIAFGSAYAHHFHRDGRILPAPPQPPASPDRQSTRPN